MPTDVKLDQDPRGDPVLLEGGVVQPTVFNFILDCPSRHIGRSALRWALVHNFQDGLTTTFNRDYPVFVTTSGNAVVTRDLVLPALNTTVAAPKSNLESIQFNGSQQQIAFAYSRIDRVEITVASLVDFFEASVIPPWNTTTAVEKGDDEPASGGRPLFHRPGTRADHRVQIRGAGSCWTGRRCPEHHTAAGRRGQARKHCGFRNRLTASCQ
jgi:hypothetical protein